MKTDKKPRLGWHNFGGVWGKENWREVEIVSTRWVAGEEEAGSWKSYLVRGPDGKLFECGGVFLKENNE